MTQVVSSTVSISQSKLRYHNFVLLRIVAALCIIAFHGFPPSHPLNPYGYVGLVLFLLISITLMGCSSRQESWMDYSARQGRKILKPWLFWTGFYGFLAWGLGANVLPLQGFSVREILAYSVAGSAVHLWYLPFIFLVSLLVRALHLFAPIELSETDFNRAQLHQQAWLLGLILMGAGSICLSVDWAVEVSPDWPWEQWITSLPTIFLGLAIATCLKLPPRLAHRWMIGICVAVLLACFWLWGQEEQAVSFRYIFAYGFGVPLFCASFSLKNKAWPQWMEKLSAAMCGVYLIHYATLWLSYIVMPSQLGDFGIVLAMTVSSFGLALLMPKLPIVRHFV